MTHLGISILSDILQATIATYLGVAAGVVAGVFFGGIVVTFIAVAIGTLAVSMLLTEFDQKYHLTDKAIEIARNLEKFDLIGSFVAFSKKVGRDYVVSQSNSMTYMIY